MPEILGHAPLLLGLLLNNLNKNNEACATAGTVVVHEQIAEADYLRDTTNQPSEAGVLHLRGKSADPQDLTQEQCDFYNRNGYLILPHVLTEEEATSLLKDARDVMKRISKGGDGITRHNVPTSGGKRPSPIGRVLATFETGQYENKSTMLNAEEEFVSLMRRPAANAGTSELFEWPIARLGCGIHQCMPSFRNLTHSQLHRFIAKSVGCGNPLVTQSQLIAKLAGVGGSIVPHQDGCISFTNPTSGLTFWYALENATLENGCLCVAPGSHLTAPLSQRLTKGDHGLPKFEDLKVPLWAGGGGDKGIRVRPMKYEYEPLEVKRGALVVFHGNLMHTSGSNKSQKSRIAYTFSIIDGNAECPEDSYMKPVVGYFEIL